MAATKVKKGWALAVPTGLFIRAVLRDRGEACPFEIYMALKKARGGVAIGSYTNLYRYIWILERKLGFIKRTGRREPADRGLGKTDVRFFRVYYELVPKFVNDPRWSNVQKAVYVVGSAYYKKVGRVPPSRRAKGGRRGRPPKYFKEVP